MGRENARIGKIGEEKAREFLKRRGYKILAENFRTGLGEIDAVARHENFIVFVEIKTRTGNSLGPPCLSVTGKKQRHIINTALCYLKKNDLVDSDWRIDVVSVRLGSNDELEDIEVIENAVEDNA